MSEKGFALAEAVFALAVIMMICAALLPLFIQMKFQLLERRQALHASYVALEAVKESSRQNDWQGQQYVDHVLYKYEVHTGGVCVFYEGVRQTQRKCTELN